MCRNCWKGDVAVFRMSDGSTGIWWYSDMRSSLLEAVAP